MGSSCQGLGSVGLNPLVRSVKPTEPALSLELTLSLTSSSLSRFSWRCVHRYGRRRAPAASSLACRRRRSHWTRCLTTHTWDRVDLTFSSRTWFPLSALNPRVSIRRSSTRHGDSAVLVDFGGPSMSSGCTSASFPSLSYRRTLASSPAICSCRGRGSTAYPCHGSFLRTQVYDFFSSLSTLSL